MVPWRRPPGERDAGALSRVHLSRRRRRSRTVAQDILSELSKYDESERAVPLHPGRPFPTQLRWGSATASYQVEGAVREGGRGVSIWDTFSRVPGAVLNGDTGDVAVDHYHRVPQDVAIMSDLGLQAYRFSVAWPRIQPTGSGPANAAGLDFYDDLVDRLLAAGIDPVVTLYHWDLPQALQDAGGWLDRDTAERLAEYAAVVARRLGDRVSMWTTINEPWCAAFLGHASGEHAPGIRDHGASLAAMHHLNLAHGLAARAVRAELGESAPVSVALNLHVVRAATDSPQDQAARHRLDLVGNEAFLGPLLDGAYPAELVEATAHLTDWSFVRPGDEATVRVPLDALGVNYYSTSLVRGRGDGPALPTSLADVPAGPDAWVACEDVEWVDQTGPRTAMGWNVDPSGLVEVLTGLHRRYPQLPLMVTENGAAFDDVVSPDGRVHDEQRVAYLHDHVAAVCEAMDAGADVRAYFVWSLLDNFEWAFGYDRRFGVVRVDPTTLERSVKDSGLWYAEVIRRHALPSPAEVHPAGLG